MKRAIFALVLTLAAATAVAAGQKPGRGSPHSADNHAADKHDGVADDGPHVSADLRFSTGDQRAIHEYYAPRRKSLPPGLQKKIARGGQLPPGWQKKMQPFPIELERRLGPLPRDCSRGIIDGRAVIYNTRSHVVIDVTVLF